MKVSELVFSLTLGLLLANAAALSGPVTTQTCLSFRNTVGTCGERCVDKETIEWCHSDGLCKPAHSDCTGVLDLGDDKHGLRADPCADNVMDTLPLQLRTPRYRDFVVAAAQLMLKARWAGHDAMSAISVADEMLRSRESCVHACHAPQLTHERLLCMLMDGSGAMARSGYLPLPNQCIAQCALGTDLIHPNTDANYFDQQCVFVDNTHPQDDERAIYHAIQEVARQCPPHPVRVHAVVDLVGESAASMAAGGRTAALRLAMGDVLNVQQKYVVVPSNPVAYCGRLTPRAKQHALQVSNSSPCGVDAAFEITLAATHTAAAVTEVLRSKDFAPALVRAWCLRLGVGTCDSAQPLVVVNEVPSSAAFTKLSA
jgi:hypothetical protein